MKVKVKKLNEDAVIPSRAYDRDFGYDVVAVSEEEIAPNVWKYGIGLAFQIERGLELLDNGSKENIKGAIICIGPYTIDMKKSKLNLSIDFRPRSSVWKTGMVLSNCEGTIDELYRGEVSAIFYHVMPDMPRYRIGDKIGQLKLGMAFPMKFVEVDELDNTERGENGYGSSGR